MGTGSAMLSLFTSLIFLCLVGISLSARISPTSCYYYYYSYSSSSETKCCEYKTGYYYSSYYTSYCPPRSVLSSNCTVTGYRCCNVTVPVNTGYNTFYYYAYFCPNYYSYYNYQYYYYNYQYYYTARSNCGFYCASTASFAIVGFCFCLCGLGFTISLCIIVKFIIGQKKKPVTIYSYSPHNPVAVGVSTGPENINFKAQFLDVSPPPYPEYIQNPSNPYPGRNITPGTNPLRAHSTGATAYPPEPAAVDTTESSALITAITGDTEQYPELTTGVPANPAQDSEI